MDDSTITAYSDSDWTICRDTKRSLTRYCLFICSSLISWKGKKQKTMSKSSCEAEYRYLVATVMQTLVRSNGRRTSNQETG